MGRSRAAPLLFAIDIAARIEFSCDGQEPQVQTADLSYRLCVMSMLNGYESDCGYVGTGPSELRVNRSACATGGGCTFLGRRGGGRVGERLLCGFRCRSWFRRRPWR